MENVFTSVSRAAYRILQHRVIVKNIYAKPVLLIQGNIATLFSLHVKHDVNNLVIFSKWRKHVSPVNTETNWLGHRLEMQDIKVYHISAPPPPPQYYYKTQMR